METLKNTLLLFYEIAGCRIGKEWAANRIITASPMPIKSLIGELPLKKNADILIANNMPRIAREAGIQGTELLSEQRGGETEPTTYEKERWELIKTHTERRTFISLLKLREWDSIKIKKFSGHKDIAMIDHYCKLEPSDYTDFQRLKRQHPEQVLQFTEDYRTDEPTNTPNPHKYCKYGLMTKKWTR